MNTRPDCSYWLSLAGFNSAYRSELSEVVYVHNDWITCSYFTIEFKKHGQSLYSSKCMSSYAVKQLEKWINEIHRWGLSQHGASCQRDVKIILEDIGVDMTCGKKGGAPWEGLDNSSPTNVMSRVEMFS